MKISFETPDKVNGLMTITVEEADYKDTVEKTLKDYRKKANIPGFRPGMAPMGLIKKQVGDSVKVDTINKFIGEQLYKYIKDNDIQMLGEPMASDKQEPQDLEKPAPYTFAFDIAVAPEITAEISGEDSIDYYNIAIDDALIDRQVEMFTSRSGHYDKAETYDAAKNDMLKGDLRELDADGNTKEGGIVVESAVLMPEYIKVDDQKQLFEGAKTGDIITFNPRKAYPEGNAEIKSLLKIDDQQAAEVTADFSYQITEISRFEKAAVGQELFDAIYGKDAVKDEKAFRQRIADGLKGQLTTDSDYKFLLDVRAYLEKKAGKLTYPDELLKRIMVAGNKDKGEDSVEKNYDNSIKELNWHLIREKLVNANGIKIDDNDVKAAAKETAAAQFAQYGMNNVPEEYLDNYAGELLKKKESVNGFVDRAIDRKLTEVLKSVVKLNEKSITLDDFNKLMGE